MLSEVDHSNETFSKQKWQEAKCVPESVYLKVSGSSCYNTSLLQKTYISTHFPNGRKSKEGFCSYKKKKTVTVEL